MRGMAAAGMLAGAPTAILAASDRSLTLKPLADGVWLHTSWQFYETGQTPSNGLVVVNGAEGLLIDTACTLEDSELLFERLREIAPDARFRLLVTHAHDDRMAGLAAAEARGIASLAHVKTARRAAEEGLGTIQEVWWEDDFHLNLDERRVELFYPGPAHTDDNVVAYLEDCGLLFGGCMLREATAVDLAGVDVPDLCHWVAAIEAVAARYPGTTIAVPGHGRPGGPQLLTHTARLAAAEAAVRCGGDAPAGL